MIKLLIIDGLNLVRRIYSALPANENDTPDIDQFLKACDNAFARALKQHQPSHAVCVFEHYDTTWRHALYPPYKANRKPQPEAMLAAFPALQTKLEQLGIAWLNIEGYEADDIIASIVHATQKHDCYNLVLSTDQLMAQLCSDQTHFHDHFNDAAITPNTIKTKYNIDTTQLADYFALVGSNSVNIPGIGGIGAKTANQLIHHYGNIPAMIQASEENKQHDQPDKTLSRLEGRQAELYLYRALFTLRNDCPIGRNLKAWRILKAN
ncbi:MAG: 5'-3' exonuclease H3TH domain-containing protein [Arenicellales bacterium]